MKIPNTLKVGGIYYNILMVDASDIEARFAELDYQTNTIKIIRTLSQEQKEEALLHEIIHTLNSKMIETSVEFLAQGLYQVFTDNKLLR